MQGKKRVLAMMLCMIMVFTSVPTGVFAANDIPEGMDVSGVPEFIQDAYDYLTTTGSAIQLKVETPNGLEAVHDDFEVSIWNYEDISESEPLVVVAKDGQLEFPDLHDGGYELEITSVETDTTPRKYEECWTQFYVENTGGSIWSEKDLDMNRNVFAGKAKSSDMGLFDIEFSFLGKEIRLDTDVERGSLPMAYVSEPWTDDSLPADGRMRFVSVDPDSDYAFGEWIDITLNEDWSLSIEDEVFDMTSWYTVEMDKANVVGRLFWDQHNPLWTSYDALLYGEMGNVSQALNVLDDGSFKIAGLLEGTYTLEVIARDIRTHEEVTRTKAFAVTDSSEVTDMGTVNLSEEDGLFLFEYQLEHIDLDGNIQPLTGEDIPVTIEWDDYVTGQYFKEEAIARNGRISEMLEPGEYWISVNGRSASDGLDYANSRNLYSEAEIEFDIDLNGQIEIQDDEWQYLHECWLVLDPVLSNHEPVYMQYDVESIDDVLGDAFNYGYIKYFDMDFDSNAVVEDEIRIAIKQFMPYGYSEACALTSDWIDVSIDTASRSITIDGEAIDREKVYTLILATASDLSGQVFFPIDGLPNGSTEPNEIKVELYKDDALVYDGYGFKEGYKLPVLSAGQYRLEARDLTHLFHDPAPIEFEVTASGAIVLEDGTVSASLPDVTFGTFDAYNTFTFTYKDADGQDKAFDGFVRYAIYEENEDGLDFVFKSFGSSGILVLPELDDGKYLIKPSIDMYVSSINIQYVMGEDIPFEIVDGKVLGQTEYKLLPTIMNGYESISDNIVVEAYTTDGDVLPTFVRDSWEFFVLYPSELTMPIEFYLNFYDLEEGSNAPLHVGPFEYDGMWVREDDTKIRANDEYAVHFKSGDFFGYIDGPDSLDDKEVIVELYDSSVSETEPVEYTYAAEDGECAFSFKLEPGIYRLEAHTVDNVMDSDSVEIEMTAVGNLYVDGEETDEVYLEFSNPIEDGMTIYGKTAQGYAPIGSEVWVDIESIDDRAVPFEWDGDTNRDSMVALPELADGIYDLWVFPELPKWIQYESKIVEFTVDKGIWSIDKKSFNLNNPIYVIEAITENEMDAGLDIEVRGDGVEGTATSSSGNHIRLEKIEGTLPITGELRLVPESNDMELASSDWEVFAYTNQGFEVDGKPYDLSDAAKWTFRTGQIEVRTFKHSDRSTEFDGEIMFMKDDAVLYSENIRGDRDSTMAERVNVAYFAGIEPGKYTVQSRCENFEKLGIEEYSEPFEVEVGTLGDGISLVVSIGHKDASTGGNPEQPVPDAARPTIHVATTELTNQNVAYTIAAEEGAIIEARENGGTWTLYSSEGSMAGNGLIEARAKFDGGAWSEVASIEITNIDKVKPELTPAFSATSVTNKPVQVFVTANETLVVTNSEDRFTFEENGTHVFTLKDLAGNESTLEVTVDWIDKTPPVLKQETISLNAKTLDVDTGAGIAVKGQDVLSISFVPEEYVRGIIRIGNKITFIKAEAGETFSMDWTVPNGLNRKADVYLDVKDTAGNAYRETLAYLLIDNTAPALSLSLTEDTQRGSNGIVTGTTVEIKATTDGTHVLYGVDGGEMINEVDENGIITLTDDSKDGQSTVVKAIALDASGNKSGVNVITFKWDCVKPEAPLVVLASMEVNKESIRTEGFDGKDSLYVERIGEHENILVEVVRPSNLYKGAEIALSEGENNFLAYYKDSAGNVSEKTAFKVIADFTAPVFTVVPGEEEGTFQVTANETVYLLDFKVNDSDWKSFGAFMKAGSKKIIDVSELLGEGTNIVSVKGKDGVNNIGRGSYSQTVVIAGEKIENQKLSDLLTLSEGAFTKDTTLSVMSVDVEAESGKAFASEPVDFLLEDGAEIEDYILVDLELGTGFSAATKLYYYDEEMTTWIALDGGEHGDSFYNAGSESAEYSFTAPDGSDVKVSVEQGMMKAMLVHFSTYGAQDDNTAPVLTAVNPCESGLTSEVNLGIQVDVDEAATVTVEVNGAVQSHTSIEDSGMVTAVLEQRGNTIKLSAEDASGNSSIICPTFTVELDTIAPVIDAETSKIGTISDDSVILDVFVGDDPNYRHAVISVRGEETFETSHEFTSAISLNEGDNLIEVYAVDYAGNVSNTESMVIVKDTTAPIVQISGVEDGDIKAKDVMVSVASESADLAKLTAKLYKDSLLVSDLEQTKAIDLTTDTLSGSNQYTLDVTAQDTLGNTSIESISFTVDTSVPDISISGLGASGFSKEALTPQVEVTPADSVLTAELKKDGSTIPYAIGDTISVEGAYSLSIAGVQNGKVAVATGAFIVDKTAPVVRLSQISAVNTKAVQPVFTVTDDYLKASKAVFTLNGGIEENLTSGQTLSAYGTYKITITAEDKAGNITVKEAAFTVQEPNNGNNSGNDSGNSSGNSSGSSHKKKSSGSSSSSGSGTGPVTIMVKDEPIPEGSLKGSLTVADLSKTSKVIFESGLLSVEADKLGSKLSGKLTFSKYDKASGILPVGDAASDVIRLTSDTAISERMRLSMQVPSESVKRPETLIAFRYDESLQDWTPVGGFYNAETGQLEFTTDETGFFTTMNVEKTFADTAQASWAEEAINTLASRYVISGYGDGDFNPNGTVTRAEFAAILCKAVELRDMNTDLSFTDVNGEWYEDTLKTAVTNGLMSGYNGQIRPNDPINREQMAVMIMNAFGKLSTENITDVALSFEDANTMSDWSKMAVAKANALGIVSGKADGTFAPKDSSTRAEAAMMVYKLLKALELI